MVSLNLPQYPPEGEPAILLYLERCLFAGLYVPAAALRIHLFIDLVRF